MINAKLIFSLSFLILLITPFLCVVMMFFLKKKKQRLTSAFISLSFFFFASIIWLTTRYDYINQLSSESLEDTSLSGKLFTSVERFCSNNYKVAFYLISFFLLYGIALKITYLKKEYD